MKMSTTVALSAAVIFSISLAVQAAGRGDGPAAREAARAARENAPASPAAEARIDQREANQQRRIDAGIEKGQLTPDEVTLLQNQETSITTLETSLKSDGVLSKEDAHNVEAALNAASLQIWAQRHDTEGNQKPVSRLGKDIFAQDSITSAIESGTLTKAQARVFLEDFRLMVSIKRRLGSDNLTPAQRTILQAQYNDLLNKYFVIK